MDEQRTMAVNPCLSIVCAIQMTPHCPVDSIPVGGHPPPGECCPLQGPQCVCMECLSPWKCEGDDVVPFLVVNGTHKPGECCNTYECQQVLISGKMSKCHSCMCSQLSSDTFIYLYKSIKMTILIYFIFEQFYYNSY